MYEIYTHLKIERRPKGILVVTMDNPPANACTSGMHTELVRIFGDINLDQETKVVVLTGSGERAFSAGGDINVLKESVGNVRALIPAILEARQIVYGVLRLERPMIARINGHAIGLGATLALLCDLTYATETAKIADPHVAMGMVAGDGGALLWPALMGYARAREYLLTGDPIRGKDAAAAGLITRAVPAEELDAVVYGMAERLAEMPTMAINLTKVAINMPLRRHFEGLMEGHIGLEFISQMSKDHAEAVQAYLEKRKPIFTGA